MNDFLKTAAVFCVGLAGVSTLSTVASAVPAAIAAFPVMFAWNYVLPERATDVMHVFAGLFILAVIGSYFSATADTSRSDRSGR